MAEGLDHFRELLVGGAVGRHEDDDVADGTRQDTAPGHGFAYPDPNALLKREGFAGTPVFHEFNAGDESDAADIADGWTGPKGVELRRESQLELAAAADSLRVKQEVEAGEGGGRAELVRGEAVAVEEGLELSVFAQESVEDSLGGERGSHGKVATGEALGHGKEVGLDTFFVGGKQAAMRQLGAGI